jgi:DNA-binding CsgD family transcriptional regulator
VRGHIKAALTKTGLHRQTELAHLLAGLAVPKRPTE